MSKEPSSSWEREKALSFQQGFGVTTAVILFTTAIGLISMWGCPQYNVWQKGLAGKAELAQADFNRQIKTREAMATLESSKALADAEVERAKGVAEANKIIGDSLKGNESYLRYLWIKNLDDAEKTGSVIYVPTEAGLPILEAGKRP